MNTSDEYEVVEEITEHGKDSTDPAGDARRRDEQHDEPGSSVTDAPKD